MNVRLSIIILIMGLCSFFGCSKPKNLSEPPKSVERATEISDKRQVTNEEPPDVLAATNIEQWKSLIPNLQKDFGNYWMTKSRQKGVDAVVLKSNGQSIVYKTAYIDVNVWNNAGDILEADIYTPKMDIAETRELGLQICKMFGFDTNKFLAWCKSVGNNWLDSPLFSIGDYNHFFRIRHSYNDQQPWIMIFGIQSEKANSEFMQELERQARIPRRP